MMVFQIRLRMAMSRRDMSGGVLASALGVRYAMVYDLTRGRVDPAPEMLCAISEALGVNLHWLLTGDGPRDLPDADYSEIQLPQGSPLLDPVRGADPARSTSRAGTLPGGAICNHAPSGISSGFADLEAAKAHARKAIALHREADELATPQGRVVCKERPSLWKRMLPWLGDIIGCVSLFALLFMGLWAGEILG